MMLKTRIANLERRGRFRVEDMTDEELIRHMAQGVADLLRAAPDAPWVAEVDDMIAEAGIDPVALRDQALRGDADGAQRVMLDAMMAEWRATRWAAPIAGR